MLKKGDIILVALLLVAAVTAIAGMTMFRSNSGDTEKIAVIKQGNVILKEIRLNEVGKSERITVEGNYKNIILVENRKIRFEESTCPDKVCVKTGWLTNEGDMAVCLPNQVMVKIEGVNMDVDGVTY
ncbi:MAG TPA: NusG domain II-containing protein [Clostridiaceae bacterium]|nr:NusG domain II-containing protein [Clostridiaceae bacterium]